MANNIHLHALLNGLFLSSMYMYYVYIWIHIHICMCECGHSHSHCVCAMAFTGRSESCRCLCLSPCWDRSLACFLISQVSLQRCTWINSPASTVHLPVSIMGSQMHAHLSISSGNWNSGLHACMTTSLATESFSQHAFWRGHLQF